MNQPFMREQYQNIALKHQLVPNARNGITARGDFSFRNEPLDNTISMMQGGRGATARRVYTEGVPVDAQLRGPIIFELLHVATTVAAATNFITVIRMTTQRKNRSRRPRGRDAPNVGNNERGYGTNARSLKTLSC
ncbi:hypothetical protein EVAR_28108_1 [Eumeta japonica]|uniref:Uncharacterized protein n=1 Tax=Eumeta variegata TaxID=151549 RepID=A0A4C1VEV0_EUMVA|nr:hypothetical protein EVAR_28108_1 [Eumeta japonica]